MPKIACLCGETINLTLLPAPDGIRILSEKARDELVDRLVETATTDLTEEALKRAIHESFRDVFHEAYLCPNCARIWLLGDQGDVRSLWTLERGDPSPFGAREDWESIRVERATRGEC